MIGSSLLRISPSSPTSPPTSEFSPLIASSRLLPTLTSIEVLPLPSPDVYRELDSKLDDEAEEILLSVTNGLAKLELLVVPECWRSEAVTELCEARGVKLVWSPERYVTSLLKGPVSVG